MPPKPQQSDLLQRQDLLYFEGVNSLVGHNLAKRQELYHAENVRSKEIGILEKREGTSRVGNALTATANYSLMNFLNAGTNNTGLYRMSTVGEQTNLYYLNSSTNDWTSVLSGILELGDSTTTYSVTNPSGSTFKYTYTGVGTSPSMSTKARVGSTVVINAQFFNAANNGTFVITAYDATSFSVTNASGVVESNKLIGTGSVRLSLASGNSTGSYACTFAEGQALFAGGAGRSFTVASDGTTLTFNTDVSGHLYNAPRSRKINYYKDRLYLGDYFIDTSTTSTNYPNGIMMSSVPLGIVALVEEDADAGAVTINVTDTKYIAPGEILVVMRGNTQITTLTVSAKTETTLTITPTVALQSADELWVENSVTGARKFRWNSVPSSGIDVKLYDTFKLTGDQNDRIRMLTNIGNVMVIANSTNMAVWDNYKLDTLDGGVGCVSDNGYTKNQGTLFFLHYTGIYATQGGAPQLISGPVARYIRGATRAGLENASMGGMVRKSNSIFCSIGDVTLYRPDGSTEKTLSNVVLEYNLQQKIWFVHSELKARRWCTYIEATDPDMVLFASDDTGYNVYQFLTGSTDTINGTTVANIPMRMDTTRLYMCKEYDKIGSPMEVGIESERGSNTRCFISIDEQPYYELQGQASKGITILKVDNIESEATIPPRGRFVRLSLRDYSNQTVKISRVFLNSIESRERENIRFEGSAEA